jgi:hypothetical protein
MWVCCCKIVQLVATSFDAAVLIISSNEKKLTFPTNRYFGVAEFWVFLKSGCTIHHCTLQQLVLDI